MLGFRLVLTLCMIQFCFQGHAQVDRNFDLKHGLFVGTYTKSKIQWVCGIELSALDSANTTLNARFDLLKDGVVQDSLICTLTIDSSQTYLKKFHDSEAKTIRYYSIEMDVAIYLCMPSKYEYVLPNGDNVVSYQFHHAKADLPKKWKKHQKKFDCFFEK